MKISMVNARGHAEWYMKNLNAYDKQRYEKIIKRMERIETLLDIYKSVLED